MLTAPPIKYEGTTPENVVISTSIKFETEFRYYIQLVCLTTHIHIESKLQVQYKVQTTYYIHKYSN